MKKLGLKRSICVALMGCLLLGMVGCSTNQKKKNSEKLEDVTIVLDWTPNTNHTGLYVAQKLGYFKKAGLNVKIIQPPEDGASVLVASGQAQFGIDFQDYMAAALTGDEALPITAIAAIIQHNTSGIISLKGKGIDSPKGMAGKTYATWDLPIEKAMLEYLVKKDGGDYNKIQMIPNTVTDVASALQTDIDCVWVYYAWDGIATQVKDIETDYFALKDFAPELDYYSPVIIGNNQYLKENPATTKAFLRAVKDGYQYAIKNPEKAANILCKEVPELDKTLVLESQKWLANQYQADAKNWGEFDSKRWDDFYQWLYEKKVLEEELKPGTGFTNEFLPMN